MAARRRDDVAAAGGRVADMQHRLELRLERAGLPAAHAGRVLEVCATALRHRVDTLGSDEHFDALHPARTLLVLLDDCAVVDEEVLAAAASIESEHAHLRIEPANAIARAVPTPDLGDELAEALVTAAHDTRLVALAERLDHARHLHLREQQAWPTFHASARALYLPVAERTDAQLARRYRWWTDTFERRFLAGATSN